MARDTIEHSQRVREYDGDVDIAIVSYGYTQWSVVYSHVLVHRDQSRQFESSHEL